MGEKRKGEKMVQLTHPSMAVPFWIIHTSAYVLQTSITAIRRRYPTWDAGNDMQHTGQWCTWRELRYTHLGSEGSRDDDSNQSQQLGEELGIDSRSLSFRLG